MSTAEQVSIPMEPEEPTEVADGAESSATTEEVTEETPEQVVDEDSGLEIREQADNLLSKAGLDLDALSTEYAENSGLSDDSFKKLEDAGFPRHVVDQFILGQQALADQANNHFETNVFNQADGKENYQKMTTWAESNMTSQEIAAFNAAVTSMDGGQASLAVAGLVSRYNAAYGQEGKTVQGDASPSSSGATFENQTALVAALSDPQFQSSPKYRAEVEAKVQRSIEKHGGSLPS